MRNIRAKYEGRCFWGGGKFLWGKVKKVGGKTFLGWVTKKIGGGFLEKFQNFLENFQKLIFEKFKKKKFLGVELPGGGLVVGGVGWGINAGKVKGNLFALFRSHTLSICHCLPIYIIHTASAGLSHQVARVKKMFLGGKHFWGEYTKKNSGGLAPPTPPTNLGWSFGGVLAWGRGAHPHSRDGHPCSGGGLLFF